MARSQKEALPLLPVALLGGLALLFFYYGSRAPLRKSVSTVNYRALRKGVSTSNYSATFRDSRPTGPARKRKDIEEAIFSYLARDGSKVSLSDNISDYFNGQPPGPAIAIDLNRQPFFHDNGMTLHPNHTRWAKTVGDLVDAVVSWYKKHRLLDAR